MSRAVMLVPPSGANPTINIASGVTLVSTGKNNRFAPGPTQTALQNGLFNATAQNLAFTRAGVARVLAGSGKMKVAVIGDSTTMGAFSNGVIYAGNKPLAFPQQLAKQLTLKGTPATNCSWFGSGNVNPATAAGYNAYNPAVTFPVAGFAPGAITVLGGFAMASTTSGATLTYTPEGSFAFDTIDIYYLGGTGGAFTVNVDGGATLATVTPSGVHSVFVTSVSCALASHAINIVTSSTTGVFIMGMAVRASTTPRVEVYNMGWSAVVVENTLAPANSYANPTNVTYQYNYFIALPVVAPDLTIINLTINDINNQTATVAQYQAALQTMVTQALVSGDCVLMIGNPCNTAAWTGGVIAPQYQAAVYAVAAASNIAVVDLTARWTSYAVTNPIMAYGDAGVGALHPSTVGNADIARALIGLLK